MSRGNSGRIVLEIDPITKDQLYVALSKQKLTLKDWFLKQCKLYIAEVDQLQLFQQEVAEAEFPYRKV